MPVVFSVESARIVAEAVTAPELGGTTFHREQIIALNKLTVV